MRAILARMTPTVSHLVSLLQRTPAVLDAWLDELPDAWLLADEGPGTFSPRAVLAHLVHGERTDWMPRLRLIHANGDTKPFEPFERWGFDDLMATHTTRAMLDLFARLRRENLDELTAAQLDEAALEAKGLHPALGHVTLRELLSTWATHDLNHLGQIARVMARTQDANVGPWKEYLGILHWKSVNE